MSLNRNVPVWKNLMKEQMYYNQIPLTKFIDEISAVEVKLVDFPDKDKLYKMMNNIGNVSFGMPWNDDISEEESLDFMSNFLAGGVLPLGGEFCKFVFLISNVSRVMTHALVRHRFLNISQMSSGNRDLRHSDILIPRILAKEENKEYLEDFINWSLEGKIKYSKMVDNKISVQDARMVLPSQNSNMIYLGFDLLSMINFFSKRMDTTEEYLAGREICSQIKEIMMKKFPEIASTLKSSCGKGCAHSKDSPHVNGLYRLSKEDDVFDWHPDSFVYDKTQIEMCWHPEPVKTRFFIEKKEVDENEFEKIKAKINE